MNTSITCENFVLIDKLFAKISSYEIKLNFLVSDGFKRYAPLSVCMLVCNSFASLFWTVQQRMDFFYFAHEK